METEKRIAVLGSTGSIGTSTLKVVESFPGKFRVVSMSAGRNLVLLRDQIRKFQPEVVSVLDPEAVETLSQEFPQTHFVSGEAGIQACIDCDGVEIVVVGIVGFAGLFPAIHALRTHKHVALANKESLVVAGPLLRREMALSRGRCIPVDSEHNGLFQLLEGRDRSQVSNIVLTASGGPLLRRPELPLSEVTPEIAIKHPNWVMGPKISVDSATLMNKGLELIEAHFLFDFAPDAIEVWIHPQSIVHAALWLKDNSCLTQMTKPDMRASIGHALSYPERLDRVVPRMSLAEMRSLEFFEPDPIRFPALGLARRALQEGPSHLVVLNAANEIAVESFLRGEIRFPEITSGITRALDKHVPVPIDTLESVFECDRRFREEAGRSFLFG